MNSETQDAINHDGWSAWLRGRSRGEQVPRLRLLYHCDIARIGALSMPGAVALRWLTLGRHDAIFGGVDGAVRALDDPQGSRAQLHVRWLPDPQRFEVEPVASARRPLHLVDLDAASASGPTAAPLTGPTLVSLGGCIAIGDRVLLGPRARPRPPPDADWLGLVGESEVAWVLRDEIRSVAQFGGSALVIGPTGAGRELVARALHRENPRAAGPFVPVNFGALPEALVESTLFGHKKGAFTVADADKKGLFQVADGGVAAILTSSRPPRRPGPYVGRASRSSEQRPSRPLQGMTPPRRMIKIGLCDRHARPLC